MVKVKYSDDYQLSKWKTIPIVLIYFGLLLYIITAIIYGIAANDVLKRQNNKETMTDSDKVTLTFFYLFLSVGSAMFWIGIIWTLINLAMI